MEKYNKKDISEVIRDLEKIVGTLENEITKSSEGLREKVERLDEEIYTLKKQPEEIKNMMPSLATKVSDNLDKKIANTLEKIKNEVIDFTVWRSKGLIICILISSLVSAIVACGATYSFLKINPPTMKVDSVASMSVDGNVNVLDIHGKLIQKYSNPKAKKQESKNKK